MAKTKIEQEVLLNADQIKNNLRHAIVTNQFLANEGKLPVAYEISGDTGIGKTSVVKDLASEFDFNYVRINVAEVQVEDRQ